MRLFISIATVTLCCNIAYAQLLEAPSQPKTEMPQLQLTGFPHSEALVTLDPEFEPAPHPGDNTDRIYDEEQANAFSMSEAPGLLPPPSLPPPLALSPKELFQPFQKPRRLLRGRRKDTTSILNTLLPAWVIPLSQPSTQTLPICIAEQEAASQLMGKPVKHNRSTRTSGIS